LEKIRLHSRTTKDISKVHYQYNKKVDIESSISKEKINKEKGKKTVRISFKGERVKVKRIARVVRLCQAILKAIILTPIYIRELLKCISNRMSKQ
jgi:hypothetical protein